MKLEQQVCSLELAKKLKKLGVKQDSLFYWSHNPNNWDYYITKEKNWAVDGHEYSAFTVSELGEMLPSFLNKELEELDDKQYRFKQRKSKTGEHIIYYEPEIYVRGDTRFISEMDKSEANARAKMLIYLLENNLIK